MKDDIVLSDIHYQDVNPYLSVKCVVSWSARRLPLHDHARVFQTWTDSLLW